MLAEKLSGVKVDPICFSDRANIRPKGFQVGSIAHQLTCFAATIGGSSKVKTLTVVNARFKKVPGKVVIY